MFIYVQSNVESKYKNHFVNVNEKMLLIIYYLKFKKLIKYYLERLV